MWIWDKRRNDWVWYEDRRRMGPLQVILVILVIIFLVLVLFPTKIEQLLKKQDLLFAPTPQRVQQGIAPVQQTIVVQPVYLVVTATPRPGWDVPITPDVNPVWPGLPTKEPPTILEWQPGQPLPEPMGPPAP